MTEDWQEVINRLSTTLDLSFPLCSIVSLPDGLFIPQTTLQLTPFGLIAITIAKKTVLVNWKDKTLLSINHWLYMLTGRNLEKLTARQNSTFSGASLYTVSPAICSPHYA